MTTPTGQEIADAGLEGWAHLLGGLQTRLHTGDFATGLALVAAIGAAAQADLDLRREHVDVRVASRNGITAADVQLARAITAIAADAGVTLDASVSRLELAIDTPDEGPLLPFWAAVMGMAAVAGPGAEVRDPAGTLPTIWFQESGREEPRQHWHPDVWVDPAQVQPRIDAALAAGGTLVSDAEAPSFWVLADPDGNRVCLCTWQDRG